MGLGLEEERKAINRTDEEIVKKIEKRMNHVRKVVEYKKSNGMEIVDKERESKVVERFKNLFNKRDLSPEKGEELARFLINTAIDLEEEMIEK